MSTQGYSMSPIGYVRAGADGMALEIKPEYLPALRGLEGFSHVVVLWWAHLCDNPEYRAILDWERPYRTAPAKLGIFATRSPVRPNPIVMTPVAVQQIDAERGLIRIPFIDAEDGTPIVDLKPYHPSADRIRDVGVPEWCRHWPQWYEDSASFDWSAEFTYG